jgi:hypothetical protein
VKSALELYPKDGIYGLTHVGVPISTVGGTTIEHRAPNALMAYDGQSGFTAVSRFEFLAHLAARGGSRLYRLGECARSVGGFAGLQGWVFEPESSVTRRGTVRLAAPAERDAASSAAETAIEPSEFAERVCYGKIND